MGLAICHTLPRDPLHRVAALFAVLAALLQFIALVDAANDHRMAWLSVSLSGTWKVTPYQIIRPDNVGVACSSSTNNNVGVCSDFLDQGRAVAGLTGTSCALTAVLAVVVMCGIVRRTPKNTALLGLYVLCLLLPFIFAVAACGVMGDGYWSKTKNALPGGSVSYSDGGALCIAACVLYGLGLTMSLIKAATFLVEHRALKDQVRQEAAARAGSTDPTAVAVVVPDHDLKVDERLALRIVNDDWERQKSIWLERRRAVVDILRQSALTSKDARGSFAKSGSLQRSSTGSAGPSTAPAPVAFPLEPITDEKVQHLHEAHHPQGAATTNGTGTSDTA